MMDLKLTNILLIWCIQFLALTVSYSFAEMGPGMMGQQGLGRAKSRKLRLKLSGRRYSGSIALAVMLTAEI